MGTHSEGTGDGIAGHRGRPGGIGGRVFPLHGQLGQILVVLCLLEVFFLGGNFLHQVVLKGFRLVHHPLVFLGLLFQLPEHVVGFRAFFLQLGLRRRQLLPGAFQLGFFRFQAHAGGGDDVRRNTHFLKAALVGLGNLLHHVQPVKQVGKAVGLENDLPVSNAAAFLHRPDTLPVLLAQGAQLLLGGVQLVLGVRNELAVGGNLGVGGLNLACQKGDFLVDGFLPAHDIGHVAIVGVVLASHSVDLRLDGLVLFLQCVNLLLDFTGGGGICRNRRDAHRHHRRQT